jgi:hypothetical protein
MVKTIMNSWRRGTRRRTLVAALAGVLALGPLAACGSDGGSKKDPANGGAVPARKAKPIGDGSTADTGPQPDQPVFKKMKPGQKPPQFVVLSWDGAAEGKAKQFSRFRKLAEKKHISMTFFLTGLYTLPPDKKDEYDPPGHNRGTSDIPWIPESAVKNTIKQVRLAWLEGNEIGTHFNGHFCGPAGGKSWTPEQWKSETDQAVKFVKEWKTNTGWKKMPPLPFDYTKELAGGRAPCLEGQDNLLKTASEMGWKYDASSPGGRQVWPGKKNGVWDFQLQSVPFPGHSFEVLSMDYNILANQSKDTTDGPSDKYPFWRKQATDALMKGFDRAYDGNRAPLFIGNHFEQWNGGIYMDAMENVVKQSCGKKGVKCVSFKQLTQWMDKQDPAVLEKLRGLEVGRAPENWASITG